jgi:hypothetical protein
VAVDWMLQALPPEPLRRVPLVRLQEQVPV